MNGTTFAEVQRTLPNLITVTVTDDTLSVDWADGRTISVPVMWFPRLAYGTAAERANFEIAGAGYGIYWLDLDEDIGVEGLLLGKQSLESESSFAQWLAQHPQNQVVTSSEKVAAWSFLEQTIAGVAGQALMAALTEDVEKKKSIYA